MKWISFIYTLVDGAVGEKLDEPDEVDTIEDRKVYTVEENTKIEDDRGTEMCSDRLLIWDSESQRHWQNDEASRDAYRCSSSKG